MLSNEFSLSEYTKINVGWGFAPDSTGGAYRKGGEKGKLGE